MQINRQVFARYLAGDAIPRHRNLQKIVRFFGVTEAELFARASPGKTQAPQKKDGAGNGPLAAFLKPLREGPVPTIASGIYFANFAYFAGAEPGIVRSLITVHRHGNLTTFRRLTGASEKSGSWWSRFAGDHRGVVVQRQFGLYFMAVDQSRSQAPSMLVVNWLTGVDNLLGGHASILTPIGPTVTAVVLNRAPSGMRSPGSPA